MATKRPNTIGSNPLKSSTAQSLKINQVKDSSKKQANDKKNDQIKPKRSSSKKVTSPPLEATTPQEAMPTQSLGTSGRVRRTHRETEVLFATELKGDEPKVLDKKAPPANLDFSAPLIAEVQTTNHRHEAMVIVKTWSQWSVVAGLTPVPVLDVIALSGAQIKMIQLLCKHYNIPFEKKVAIAVATGLIGGTLTSTIATGATRLLVKNIPIMGQIFNFTVEPALSFGSTYAIGTTFVKHFESKGDLLSFKSEQMKDYATEQFQKGKKLFLSKKSGVTA